MPDANDHKPAQEHTPPQSAAGNTAPPDDLQPGHDPLLEQAVDDLLRQMDEAEKNVHAAITEETEQELADLAALTNAAANPATANPEIAAAPEAPADTTDLGDVVDALLEEQDAAASAEQAAAETAVDQSAGEPASEVATAPAEAEAAVETAPANTDSSAPAADTTELPNEPAPAEAQPAPATPEPTVAAKPEVSPTLDDLDRELAGVASEMLAKEQVPAPAPTPAPQVAAPVAPEVPAPAPKVEPVAAAGTPTATRAEQAKAAMHSAIATATPKAKAAGSWLRVHVEPKAIAALAVFSKPIASKSKAFKHSLGLVALYTLFVASAFWAYALFLRPAHIETKDAQPFNFQKSGLPSPNMIEHASSHDAESKDSGHGEASGGHGEAKKDDGHGGGHGDAKAGKKDAKKPVLNSDSKSVINKTLDDRTKKAKDAKKGSGGSGGGGGHGSGH